MVREDEGLVSVKAHANGPRNVLEILNWASY
jgi:hypothetical protein